MGVREFCDGLLALTGRTLTVTILHVDVSGSTSEVPFYTVRLPDNSERQTERQVCDFTPSFLPRF